jgi:hypothetical protein
MYHSGRKGVIEKEGSDVEDFMLGYDYYENEFDRFAYDNDRKINNVILDVCTRDTHVESYRFNDSDEVCDDGRSGYRI